MVRHDYVRFLNDGEWSAVPYTVYVAGNIDREFIWRFSSLLLNCNLPNSASDTHSLMMQPYRFIHYEYSYNPPEGN